MTLVCDAVMSSAISGTRDAFAGLATGQLTELVLAEAAQIEARSARCETLAGTIAERECDQPRGTHLWRCVDQTEAPRCQYHRRAARQQASAHRRAGRRSHARPERHGKLHVGEQYFDRAEDRKDS